MLQTNQLDFNETKILFTENIIFNYIELIKDLRLLGLKKDHHSAAVETINKKSIDILAFLCERYPQTKNEAPNLTLRSIIPKKDEKEKLEYDLIRNSKIEFRLKELGKLN